MHFFALKQGIKLYALLHLEVGRKSLVPIFALKKGVNLLALFCLVEGRKPLMPFFT